MIKDSGKDVVSIFVDGGITSNGFVM